MAEEEEINLYRCFLGTEKRRLKEIRGKKRGVFPF
jgi:hypothetical protein